MEQPQPTTTTTPDPFLAEALLHEALLAAHPALKGLSVPSRARLAALARWLTFAENAIVADERTPLAGLYLVFGGDLLLLEGTAPTGVVLRTTVLHSGASLGSTALVQRSRIPAGLRALGELTLALVTPAAFAAFAAVEPSAPLASLLAADAERLAGAVGLQVGSIDGATMQPAAVHLLPYSMMRLHRVVPIDLRAGLLRVAMENPSRLVVLDEVLHHLRGVVLQPVLVSPEEMAALLRSPLVNQDVNSPVAPAEAFDDLAQTLSDVGGVDDLVVTRRRDLTDVEEQPEGAPIIRIVNQIFLAALKRGASDIHIEPQSGRIIVRFRIDGELEDALTLPRTVQSSVASRLKLLAGMDITDHRKPQDGRISFMWKNRRIDARTSTIPTKHGEKVCLRLLDSNPALLSLDVLIDHRPSLVQLRAVLQQPQGIVLVTGPTGSGKTTTLYSALTELNTRDVNISTVEDPIEYDLEGVNQVEVNRAGGADFASVLRAFLRQDPDIILVGETRDLETGRIAIDVVQDQPEPKTSALDFLVAHLLKTKA